MSFEEACEICKSQVALPAIFACVQLVVGAPGIIYDSELVKIVVLLL